MNRTVMISSLFFLTLLSASIQAQSLSIPSVKVSSAVQPQLLSALNSVEGLGLTSDQTSKLKADNKTYSDGIFKILNSSTTDALKESQLLNLGKTRDTFLTGLLGKTKFGTYTTKINNIIKPFKSSLGLAKLLF